MTTINNVKQVAENVKSLATNLNWISWILIDSNNEPALYIIVKIQVVFKLEKLFWICNDHTFKSGEIVNKKACHHCVSPHLSLWLDANFVWVGLNIFTQVYQRVSWFLKVRQIFPLKYQEPYYVGK